VDGADAVVRLPRKLSVFPLVGLDVRRLSPKAVLVARDNRDIALAIGNRAQFEISSSLAIWKGSG